MSHLVLAIRFLTIIPIPGREAQGPGALGRASWWFPVIGLGLGLVLAALDRIFAPLLPSPMAAVLLLALWKGLTGGIHLDGLADCLDGLAGRDPAHRRAIMKDSALGVFGAVGVVLVLLLSAAALDALPSPRRWQALLVAPAIGRTMPLLVGAWHRPAADGVGLGAEFLAALPRGAGLLAALGAAALCMLLLGPAALTLVLAALAAAALWAAFLARRLGGLTGDVLGAVVELGELAALAATASLQHLGRL